MFNVAYLEVTIIFDSLELEVMLGLHLLLLADRGRGLNHDSGGVLGHHGGVSDSHNVLLEQFQLREKWILKLTADWGYLYRDVMTVSHSFQLSLSYIHTNNVSQFLKMMKMTSNDEEVMSQFL